MHRATWLATVLASCSRPLRWRARQTRAPWRASAGSSSSGDSITYSGQYIEFVEAYLRLKDPALRCEFLDLGLPSETVSGLSEPGHAGGQFPRPDLHERLDRVLDEDQARPGRRLLRDERRDLLPVQRGAVPAIPGGDPVPPRAGGGRRARRCCTSPRRSSTPSPIRARTLPGGPAPNIGSRSRATTRSSNATPTGSWPGGRDGWDVVDIHGPMKRYLARRAGPRPGLPARRRRRPHRRHRALDHRPARSSGTGASRAEGPAGRASSRPSPPARTGGSPQAGPAEAAGAQGRLADRAPATSDPG